MLRIILFTLAGLFVFTVAVAVGMRFFNNTGPLAVHYPSPAIADTKRLLSAQAAYQSLNGGFFEGRIQCLFRASECLPGYPQTDPWFVEENMAVPTRWRGPYVVTFHPGPKAPAEEIKKGKVSPSSVTAFAYTWVPQDMGGRGLRSFCGDASGRICYYPPGLLPPIKEGACMGIAANGAPTAECNVVH